MRFEVGPLTIGKTGDEDRDGPSPAGADISGTAHLFRAGGAGADLTLAYVDWRNDEAHVELTTAHDGPVELHDLERRNRLTVQQDGPLSYVELQQAWIDRNGSTVRVRRRKATELELNEGAGIPFSATLLPLGAIGVGTKEELLGADGRRRGYMCVTFEHGDTRIPLAAFVAARVLPVINGFEGP